jgi:hypothetical protein
MPPYGQPAQPYGHPGPYDQPTQPFQQAAPYGQAGQPYGQPGQPYGQPYGQPGQQYGGPYYPPYPQQPKRSRTGFYVALGAVALVVAVGVAVAVAATSSNSGKGTPSALSGSSSASASATDTTPTDAASSTAGDTGGSQVTHNVVAPTSAGPLHLLSNADTAQRISKITASMAGNVAYAHPKIGFYTLGSDSSFSVWMIAENSAEVPAFKTSISMLGTSAVAHQIAQAATMTDVTTRSPGPLGGALLCGKLPVNGGKVRACEWVDNSSFGWVYFMPTVNDSDILTYTLDLRSGAEQ